MQSAVIITRLLVLVVALATVLLIASPFTAGDAPRQFCSPNEDVCFSPLDCCSGQCVNAVCCDELLGTCNFDYFGPQWKRGSNDATATAETEETTAATTAETTAETEETTAATTAETTAETEEPTTPTTEHVTPEDEEEATTQNSADLPDSGSDNS